MPAGRHALPPALSALALLLAGTATAQTFSGIKTTLVNDPSVPALYYEYSPECTTGGGAGPCSAGQLRNATYYWDMGDGTTSTGGSAKRYVTEPVSYTHLTLPTTSRV